MTFSEEVNYILENGWPRILNHALHSQRKIRKSE